jgi:CelD/BcsL family acetyltransferase involved in cellulose biosynthesis
MAILTQRKLPAPHESSKLQYKVYSDLSEVAAISRQWDALLAKSRCNKAFGSMEWYLASCRVQSSVSPYLVTAALGSEITCLLPLALNIQNGTIIFPHFANDYNDVLISGGDLAQAVDLLKYALSLQPDCRRIILSKLRPDSTSARFIDYLKNDPDIECRHRETEVYSYIQLPNTFDEYLMSRSKLSRRNIKYALRKAEANGLTSRKLLPAEFEPVGIPETFIRLILDRQNEKCLFRLPHAQSFVQEVLPSLFAKSHMQVFATFKKERIVAMDLYFVTGNGLIAWNGGFCTAIGRLSPGTALIAFGIQQAIAMGIQEFDFGDGDEDYKEHWVNSKYTIGTMELVSKLCR